MDDENCEKRKRKLMKIHTKQELGQNQFLPQRITQKG
jgi:hypothetical protein